MENERLYIVQGRGNDSVGLVGKLTGSIGAAGGNVVDLRQDVLHGLFTLCMVVDLSKTELRLEDFCKIVRELGEDTGLVLSVDKYVPVPRRPDKTNVLIILVGEDKPGIIGTLAATLGKQQANIEFAQTIAREGIFLAELLTDVSHCAIPIPNLMQSLEKAMTGMGIKATCQTEDVFNKKRRAILFALGSSLIDASQRAEILEHAGLSEQALAEAYPDTRPLASLRAAASRLEGLPAEVLAHIASGITVTNDTVELLQTLRVMGYRIALSSTAFSPFADALKETLGMDQSYGVRLLVDDDSRAVTGQVSDEDYLESRVAVVLPRVALREGLSEQDVTVVPDAGLPQTPGIHVKLSLDQLLGLVNDRIVNRNQLVGLLGSLGVPRPRT